MNEIKGLAGEFELSATGWKAVLDKDRRCGQYALNEIFERYRECHRNQTLSLENENTDLEALRIKIMRKVIRDLYMTFAIEGDKERMEEASLFLQTIEGSDSIIQDIKELLQHGYNSGWIYSQCFYDFALASGSDDKLFEEAFADFPDSDSRDCLKEINSNRLLRYRVVSRLDVASVKRDKHLSTKPFKEALEKIQRIRVKSLTPGSKHFDKRLYYRTLVVHHHLLKNTVSDFFDLMCPIKQKEQEYWTTDQIEKILLSENKNDVHNTISTLDQIRSRARSAFFPLFPYVKAKEECGKALVFDEEEQKKKLASLHKKKMKDLKNRILLTANPPPLSHFHRINFAPIIIQHLSQKYKEKPKSLYVRYLELAQWFFKGASTVEQFKKETVPLAIEISLLSEKIQKTDPPPLIENSLVLLFKGKLSKEKRKDLIDDLNTECVRLIRQISPGDFCKAIPEFLKEDSLSPPLERVNSFYSELEDQTEFSLRSSSDSASSHVESTERDSSSSYSINSRMSGNSIYEKDFYSYLEKFGNEKGKKIDSSEVDFLQEGSEKALTALANHFNNISILVVYSIVGAKNEKQSQTALEACLDLADAILKKPCANLHVAYALFSGINNAAVSRLSALFGRLDTRYKLLINQLELLFSFSKNYQKYRAFIANTAFPVIPSLSIFAQEFTFATESEKTDEQKEIIKRLVNNFEKMQHLLKITVPTKKYQTGNIGVLSNIHKALQVRKPKSAKKEGGGTMSDKEWSELLLQDQLWHVSHQRWKRKK